MPRPPRQPFLDEFGETATARTLNGRTVYTQIIRLTLFDLIVGEDNEHGIANIFEIEKKMMDKLRPGYCSYPDPTADPCDGGVVKSHTVRRKGGLSAIAEGGHVLTVKPTMKGLLDEQGQSWLRRIGTSKASVFPGFCALQRLDRSCRNSQLRKRRGALQRLSCGSFAHHHRSRECPQVGGSGQSSVLHAPPTSRSTTTLSRMFGPQLTSPHTRPPIGAHECDLV